MNKKIIITTFLTSSGALYQIYHLQKKVRRFRRSAADTSLLTEVWKEFSDHTKVVIGKPVTIYWPEDEATPGMAQILEMGGCVIPFTLTSPVAIIYQEGGDIN